jgi:cell division protein ZapA
VKAPGLLADVNPRRGDNVSSNGNGLNNSIRVEIYDQSYNLRGPDPDYLFKLAEFVDLKMRTVAQQTATVDSLRLAVLAALNIADEYTVLKRKYDALAGEFNKRTHSLQGALDEVLSETRRAG